jgi:hypothetical protein
MARCEDLTLITRVKLSKRDKEQVIRISNDHAMVSNYFLQYGNAKI